MYDCILSPLFIFDPPVGFTNSFPEMLAMLRRCAVPMFNQGRFNVKVKNNPLSHVAHGLFITYCDSSSLRFHLPLQFFLKLSSDIRGRHYCFRFRKHPSRLFNSLLFLTPKCKLWRHLIKKTCMAQWHINLPGEIKHPTLPLHKVTKKGSIMWNLSQSHKVYQYFQNIR